MRLLMNATIIRSEGGVTLLQHLVEQIQEEAPDVEVILYIHPTLLPKIQASERIQVIPHQVGGYLKRLFWEQWTLPRLLYRHRVDRLLSFGNTGPLFAPCPQILYLQQAIPYADFQPQAHRLRWRGLAWLLKILIGVAQLGSRRIIVPTSWLVEPLRKSVLGQLPRDRYVVSPPGTLTYPQGTMTDAERQLLEAVCDWRASGYRVLIYPTFLAPYKNIPFLLEAISHLTSEWAGRFKLLLTFDEQSPEYFPCKPEILQELRRRNLSPETVMLTGVLSRTCLQELYQRVDVLVFPSLVETLGLPLLEAMAAGVPIVASETAYAREVCEEAAFYGKTPQAFAEAIRTLLTQEDVYWRQQEAARCRSRQFLWPPHVQAILTD